MTEFPTFNPVKPEVVQGSPISDDMRLLFSPWGVPTGVAVWDEKGIVVVFEGGLQITFAPREVQFG